MPPPSARDIVLHDPALLCHVLSYLPPAGIAAAGGISVLFRATVGGDTVWQRAWPWRLEWASGAGSLWTGRAVGGGVGGPPPPFPTFRHAHAQCHAYLAAPPVRVADNAAAGIGVTATCFAFQTTTAVVGFADGMVAVVERGGGGRQWEGGDGSLGRPVAQHIVPTGSVRHLQVTPDGEHVYFGTWRGAVHELATRHGASGGGDGGDVRVVVSGLGGPVYALRVEGGRLYTCCSDGEIREWAVDTGALTGVLEGHTGAVTDFCTITLPPPPDTTTTPADGTPATKLLASTSYDGSVRLWDLTSRACVCVVADHRGPVWTIAGRDNTLFTGSADGTVRVWRVGWQSQRTGAASSQSISIATTNRVAGCSAPQLSVEVTRVAVLTPWSTASHKQVYCIHVVGPVLFAGASDGSIMCWDAQEQELAWVIGDGGRKDGVRRIGVMGDTLYTCTVSGQVSAYRFPDPFTLPPRRSPPPPPHALPFGFDALSAASSGGDGGRGAAGLGGGGGGLANGSMAGEVLSAALAPISAPGSDGSEPFTRWQRWWDDGVHFQRLLGGPGDGLDALAPGVPYTPAWAPAPSTPSPPPPSPLPAHLRPITMVLSDASVGVSFATHHESGGEDHHPQPPSPMAMARPGMAPPPIAATMAAGAGSHTSSMLPATGLGLGGGLSHNLSTHSLGDEAGYMASNQSSLGSQSWRSAMSGGGGGSMGALRPFVQGSGPAAMALVAASGRRALRSSPHPHGSPTAASGSPPTLAPAASAGAWPSGTMGGGSPTHRISPAPAPTVPRAATPTAPAWPGGGDVALVTGGSGSGSRPLLVGARMSGGVIVAAVVPPLTSPTPGAGDRP